MKEYWVDENGASRKATPEEKAQYEAWEAEEKAMPPSDSDRLAALEAAMLDAMMRGVV